tara:strand:- start:1158 stop:1439 length:282 start_codon:yes stop_codon:yes gene_type:complete
MKTAQILNIWKKFLAESNIIAENEEEITEEEEMIEEEAEEITEEEEFQQSVKKQHPNMKQKLIGGGDEPNSPPYTKKPSYKRSKSAPVGFGGL